MRYLDLLVRLAETRSSGVALGLDRTRAVLARLGNPHRGGITVQIAGTNGKGSTAAMTDAILRACGIRTGLFTSPHLSRFTERIRIDGREVNGDRLGALGDPVFTAGVPLTYFEISTVLAFLCFADAGVDAIVLETGLGGRLDATTVCDPVATAITSIALDHAEFLGPTLGHIAREKAGIAKPGVPLYLAELPPDADAVIAAEAIRVGAPLRRLGRDFVPPAVPPALDGPHQIANAAIALALSREVARACGRSLDAGDVATGLRGVLWPGRLETIGDDLLLDCAHNTEGAVALTKALATRDGPARRRALVFSVVAGKAAGAMLATLAPHFDAIVLTRSSNARSLAPEALAAMAPPAMSERVRTVGNAIDALAAARAAIGPGGLVVAAGSTFLIGDLRAALLDEVRDPLPTSDPYSLPSP